PVPRAASIRPLRSARIRLLGHGGSFRDGRHRRRPSAVNRRIGLRRYCDQINRTLPPSDHCPQGPSRGDCMADTNRHPKPALHQPTVTGKQPNATVCRPNATRERPTVTVYQATVTVYRATVTVYRAAVTVYRATVTGYRTTATLDCWSRWARMISA